MADEPDTGGEITYVDQGDRTLVIDNRGPTQQRYTLPKSQRGSIAVSAAVRQELEDRVETEIEPLRKLREEEANPDVDDLLPPVEDPDDVKKREEKAFKQLEEANKAREGQAEEQQERARQVEATTRGQQAPKSGSGPSGKAR